MPDKIINLKEAKISELGQVPIGQWLDFIQGHLFVILASTLAGSGTNSTAIGFSVFFALHRIVGAIEKNNQK